MSSILDALEKAKREREQLQRGGGGVASQPAPAAPAKAAPEQASGGGMFHPPAPMGFQPPMLAPLAAFGAPAQAPRPAPESGLKFVVFGMTLGVALFASAALVFVTLRPTPSSSLPAASPSVSPTATASPTPAPTPTPTPTPSPTPTPQESDQALVIEDIRYNSQPPTGPDGAPLPIIVITPTPTPYIHPPRQGEAPMLLNGAGQTPPPVLIPAPLSQPMATPTPIPTPESPRHRDIFAEEFTDFKIDGVLYDTRRPVILVAGRERAVGDIVHGYKIERIDPESVLFSKGLETIRARF
jgi:hypothetical protein